MKYKNSINCEYQVDTKQKIRNWQNPNYDDHMQKQFNQKLDALIFEIELFLK